MKRLMLGLAVVAGLAVAAATAAYVLLFPDVLTGPPAPGQPPALHRIFLPPILWRTPTDQDAINEEIIKRASLAVTGAPLPGTPDLADLPGRLKAQGLAPGAPVFVRIFKREFELELWLRKGRRFERFATYPVCNWSGTLGPKLMEGDRQSPEGFYTVDARALNPKSNYHRAFNLGFPNAFDRAKGRTGSFLMVHGACASVGCYAMTNPVIEEIWTLVEAALRGGQKRFHVHVYPFRMTPENLIRYRELPWVEFWQNLKQGYDAFEVAQTPPRIAVCDGRYAVAPGQPGSPGNDDIVAGCPGL
ncbi:MAG: murein L,D-transpeptidase family protein [Hyphomicrobiaceae bacterium]|nr:murein L,D-transpeptidase family protein [Hyphomicrobiaceae bacterium]